MKINRMIAFILCLILISGIMPGVLATTEQEQGNVVACYGLDATAPYMGYGQIVENSQAVFLYERNSNTLLYTQNPDGRVYPSSLVKILTAYLAIENGNLDTVVTVREDVIEQVPLGAVTAELLPGEQLTLRDLIYCMMVGSANDAASVIADHICGSESAFVEMMNEYVQTIGCTATILKNPHGLHDEEQVSSVRDQARILSEAMENQIFRSIFGTVSYTVPATNTSPARELTTGNYLMSKDSYYDSRVTGGRTGIGDDGYRCLATTAEAEGMEFICILMGAKSTKDDNGNTLVHGGFKETKALYDTVFDSYKIASVIYKGQPMKQVSVLDGVNEVVIGPNVETKAILPKDASFQDLAFRYSDFYEVLKAPLKKGDLLSSVEIWYGNMCIAHTDLYAMNSVRTIQEVEAEQEETEKKTNSNDGTGAGKIVAIIAISVFAIVAILAFVLRLLARRKDSVPKMRDKRRRRNRRRGR